MIWDWLRLLTDISFTRLCVTIHINHLMPSIIKNKATLSGQNMVFRREIEVLEEELQCFICHQEVDDPRVLNCQHSFCYGCLGRIQKRRRFGGMAVRCPKCKVKTKENINKLAPDARAISKKDYLDALKAR